MCFYHDYDWTADVWEDVLTTDAAPHECYECHARIHPGEPHRWVYQQEHEACRRCEDDPDWQEEGGNDPGGEDCKAGNHDYGETFECRICDRCNRLLEAIRRAEEADGCRESEAQPAFGEIRELDREVWEEYAEKFARLGLLDEIALIPRPDAEDAAEMLVDDYPGYWCEEYGEAVPEGAELGGSD